MTDQVDWHGTYTSDELARVGGELAARLKAHGDTFCLWLRGPLGAGKTTLTGHILKAMGLPRDAPVTSPTYTYMNEYRIDRTWYAHLDLYRATGQLSTEDLGLLDARPFQGVFVEWPDRLANDPALRPTHILTITPGSVDNGREAILERV